MIQAVNFQDYAEQIRPLLDARFAGHLADLLDGAGQSQFQRRNNFLSGGKLVRGSLLCLVASALAGAMEEALPRAIAVELIQTATLIHDDIVDRHETRRNNPALWTIEGTRKAVLLGDIIFASAIRMMSELGREDGLIVSGAIAEVSQGAYREPLNPSSLIEGMGEWDAGLYEKIIYLKTGALFAAACRLGAVSAGVDDTRVQEWHRYGLKIGEAYQIADDLHDIERVLEARSMTKDEMISLAPALLFFVKENRPYIVDVLRGKSPNTEEELLTRLEAAAETMKAEIERRLLSALSAIRMGFPENEYGIIARRAPWDIIAMFDGARSPASLP